MLRGAQHVTVASRALVDRVSELGVLWRRITYLPNTSSLTTADQAHGDSRAAVYTHFGEVSPAHLLRLWARISDRVPEATLCVVGAGPNGEERELSALATAKGIRSIRIHGELLPEQLSLVVGSCGLALFPCEDTLVNRTRCSVRLVDLVALGLPIVAHSVGECGHLVRGGESGLLAQPGDDDAFVRAAVILLNDPVLARRMGGAAKALYARSLSSDLAGAVLSDLYNAAAGSWRDREMRPSGFPMAGRRRGRRAPPQPESREGREASR